MNNQTILLAGAGLLILCSSSAVAAAIATGMIPLGPPTTTAAPAGDTSDSGSGNGLDGARLITVGTNSLTIVGSKCSKGKIAFSPEKNGKWVWRLHKVGDYDGNDVYTIESDFRNFNSACPERFLTAPTGCTKPPFLAKRESGPRQSWIVKSNGDGYYIRNLSCVKGRNANTYLMASGSKTKKPLFTSGTGSTFTFDTPTSSDV